MNETPDKPTNQALKPAQPDEDKPPQLREVPHQELTRILKEHQTWLESEGKEGNQADLREANLREAYLGGTNLQEADLGGANLQEATLGDADLRKANLGGTNLQKAYLWKANLQEANVG